MTYNEFIQNIIDTRGQWNIPDDYAKLRILMRDNLKNNCPFLKNKKPWNNGLTKETDYRLRKVSENSKGVNKWSKGRKVSDETRAKISLAQKNLDRSNRKTNKGKIAITNGVKLFFIDDSIEIPNDFYRGNCYTKGPRDMSNYYNNIEMMERKSKQNSGSNNPMYGNGYKVSGGNNGHAKIDYYFNDIKFECRKYLVNYLKQNGFPAISVSTIRGIENGSYGIRIANKYAYIIENLTWRFKDNEN